ncbi:hypothetical protein D3C76_1540560 [compost metagenome]
MSGGQAGVHGRAALHADAMRNDLRVGAFEGQCHAGKQTAAGQRHQYLSDIRQLFKDLQPQCALAGDDGRVIEWR